MVHAMNCITMGAGTGGGGCTMNKLWISRDNMKGNSETQRKINGNSNSNGNEVQVLEEMTHFAVN